MKRFIFLLFFLFLTVIPSFATEDIILPSAKGKILNVEYFEQNDEAFQVKQIAEILIKSGEYKGNIIKVDNVLSGNPFYDITLKKGLNVILHVEIINGEVDFAIENIERANILLFLALIFGSLLIFVGRKKGIFSFLSILLTSILVFKILSFMILKGFEPITGTIIVSLLSTAITIYLVAGFNKKSTSAIIGCLLSLICAIFLSFLTVKLAHLTGFSYEYSIFLYASNPELNYISITISTMILATLGAVMDIAISIASTINEIYTIDNSKTFKELFNSGMNVGKDIIGTMANTLILVYLGSSLPLILLTSNIDMQKFVNMNQIVTEIASALIGSSAIIICVPITAFITSKLITTITPKFIITNNKD